MELLTKYAKKYRCCVFRVCRQWTANSVQLSSTAADISCCRRYGVQLFAASRSMHNLLELQRALKTSHNKSQCTQPVPGCQSNSFSSTLHRCEPELMRLEYQLGAQARSPGKKADTQEATSLSPSSRSTHSPVLVRMFLLTSCLLKLLAFCPYGSYHVH